MKKRILNFKFSIFALLFFSIFLFAKSADAATYYVSPIDNIASAISSLNPGDTLILRDGTYSNVFLDIDCSLNASNGPITIKAENERRATLKSALGTDNLIHFRNCSGWRWEGIIFRGTTVPATDGFGQLWFENVSNTTLLRNIFFEANCGTKDCSPFFGSNISDSLFMENEFLKYTAHALDLYGSDRNVIMRNYCNPGSFAPTSDFSSVTGDVAVGDCIAVYHGSDNKVLNNISENNYQRAGCIAAGGWDSKRADNNQFKGNICLNGSLFLFKSFTPDTAANLVAEHNLAVAPPTPISAAFGPGLWMRGGTNWTFKNFTLIGWGNYNSTPGVVNAVFEADGTDGSCSGTSSFTMENSVLIGNGRSSTGYLLNNCAGNMGVPQSLDHTGVFNNVQNFSPSTYVSNTVNLSSNPYSGGCVVFPPAGSQLIGAGKNGEDLGAKILYAYDNNGNLTNTKLWNAANGKWIGGSGAIVPGINDSNSLIDIETRLHPLCSSAALQAAYGGIVPTPTPPAVTISANPSTITSGQSSTLTWSSTNATSCTASGAWTGSKATSGTQSVSPAITSIYTLTCTGTGGSASNSITVTVTPSSTKFAIGDRVQVTSGPLNVRSTPSTTGTLIGTQSIGALGTVIGGPTNANGFNWWNINYDTGADGWSVEDFLTKFTPTLAGDLNNDRIVNSLDWSIMNGKWLTNDPIADLNKDGIVNTLDWSIMSGNWLKTI